MPRKSLSWIIAGAGLGAIAALLLLRGSGTETKPPGDRGEPAPRARPTSAEPRPTGLEAASMNQNAGASARGSHPPARAENTVTGEEGALSPTRTGVRLYGNARIKPLYNLHDDAIDGVQISDLSPGSFWQELGIEDGDVIVELNGQLIDSPAASVELMNQISRGYVLNLRLRSAEGRERFIDYRTPDLP